MQFTTGIFLFLFVFVCCCGASILNGTAIITELKNDIIEGWNKSSEFVHKETKAADKNLQVLKNSIAKGLNKTAEILHKETEVFSSNVMKNWNKVKQFIEKESKTAKSNVIQALNYTDTFFQKEKRVVEDKAEEIHTALERGWNASESGCTCAHYTCGCCTHLELAEIELNATICANVTYLVKDYGVSFTVTLNHYTLYNETISARNPPPVCFGMPYVKELAEVCIRLYDVNATSTSLHACTRVEARMKHILVAKYDLGCFTLGPPGVHTNSLVTSMDEKATNYPKLKQVPAKITVRPVDEVKREKMLDSEISNVTFFDEMFTVLIMGVLVIMMLAMLITRANTKLSYDGYDVTTESQKLLV